MGKDVIIACDFDSGKSVMDFLDGFGERKPFVKIGMELFYAEGPGIINDIKEKGHRIFLDLKLHDIPNTVRKTMKVLAGMEIDMVNVHAAGTIKMMEAAMEGLEEGSLGERPKLIAVTQLTSTSQKQMEEDLLIQGSMEDVVMHYAKNAKLAALDGVVCSPHEAEAVHMACGREFITVTPGIRFAEDSAGDQTRIMTPEKAKLAGPDYIVVGRSITGAEHPQKVYERCLEEFLDR